MSIALEKWASLAYQRGVDSALKSFGIKQGSWRANLFRGGGPMDKTLQVLDRHGAPILGGLVGATQAGEGNRTLGFAGGALAGWGANKALRAARPGLTKAQYNDSFFGPQFAGIVAGSAAGNIIANS